MPASTFHLCLASPIVSAIYGNKGKWYIWIFIDLLDLLLFNSSAISLQDPNEMKKMRAKKKQGTDWTLVGLRSTMGAMCGLPSTPLDKSRQQGSSVEQFRPRKAFLPFFPLFSWIERRFIGRLEFYCANDETRKEKRICWLRRKTRTERKNNFVAVFLEHKNFHFFLHLIFGAFVIKLYFVLLSR